MRPGLTMPSLAVILLLAACGVDGPPSAPTPTGAPTAAPGVTVTGDARIGIRTDDL